MVSWVVLVVAVVWLGGGRALTRLEAALSPSEFFGWYAVCAPPGIPRLTMLCYLLGDCQFVTILADCPTSMYSLSQMHRRYLLTVAPRRPR
jgi:hypothetical protein